jgi:membrane protein CcdC involved in cytochrome C biogenesis
VVTGAVIALVFFLRMRGMRRVRRLRLETLWVVPAIFLLVLAVSIWEHPPTALGWLWMILALAIGAGAGWQRGKMMRLTVDPVTHTLNQQSSPAALLFIVALILVRQGLRYEVAQHGIDVLKITGILLAFAFGLMSAMRIEMYLRARKLLEQARATSGSV